MEAFAKDFSHGRDRVNADRLRIAVVGAGSRGAGMAETLQASPDWDLAAICDVDSRRAGTVSEKLGGAPWFEAIDELLDSVEVDAVAIATPLRALFGTGMTALRAGKHVLVEQPLADSLERGQEMAAEADARGVVLMANKAQCFEPAVQKMQKLVGSGSLGDILFVEAVRTESNLARTDRDVFWDLAPDSLALLDYVFAGRLNPQGVSALGGDPLGTGRDCVGHVIFRLPNDATVHLHVNNLSRVKSHQLVIAGSQLVLVWDATLPQEQLAIFDSDSSTQQRRRSPYWTEPGALQVPGEDGQVPAFGQEARDRVAAEFARRVRGHQRAPSTNTSGLRVLGMLEAVTRSRGLEGQASSIHVPGPEDYHQQAAGSWLESVLWSR
jgi:predicted dehydrogenase